MELPCHLMSWHNDNRKDDEVIKMIGSTTGYKTIATGGQDSSFTLIESRTGVLFMEETAPIDIVEVMNSLNTRKKRGKIL